jgi:uncharacterized repeat protein (TIGR01451 family)
MRVNLKRIIAVSLMLTLWFAAGSAQALTPANALLKNTAKLVYDGNTTGIFSSVEVKVRLIKTNVTVLETPIQPITLAEGQTYQGTYKVLATNNGEDTYTLSNGVVNTGGNLSNTSSFTYSETNPTTTTTVTLGASALTAATTTATLLVPYDSAGVANVVNGLAVNDTIRVGTGTTEFTIASVTHNATNNTTTIVVNSSVNANAGDGLFEVKTFTLDTVSVGTLPVAPPSVVATDDLVVTSSIKNSDAASTAVSSAVTITVVRINMTKYVACVSAPSCDETSATGGFDYDKATNVEGSGDTYYLAGIEAQPGAVLEYLIVVNNTSPSTIENSILTDVLAGFTTYQPNTTLLNGVTVVAGTETAGAFLLTNAGLLLDNAAGRTADTVGTGNIAAGTKAYVVYQAKLD